WYTYVERFAGIAGNRDGLPQLPDGDFLPGYPLNALEDYFAQQLKSRFTNRHVISARCAHLSEPQPIHLEQGRAQCQNRVLCQRGCPFGGYFSSNSSTLPWAQKTGKLTILPYSIAESVIYDEDLGKATGVSVINAQTKERTDYYAKIIFVNASAFHTNQILLNSTSGRFPGGLGNDHGLLGTHIAFHNYRAKVTADYDGLAEFSIDGRTPTGGYIPRFRNLEKQDTDFLRGYAATFNGSRYDNTDTSGFGISLKEQLASPGLTGWKAGSHMMGETIPKKESRIKLLKNKSDAWGMPLVSISVNYDDNDEKMIKDFHEQLSDMYQKAGFTNIQKHDSHQAPGLDIHEMGGVRMGNDPNTSLLNKFNQLHHCKNVFVTDGACMTSTSTQNPSLTYMALTARAVDYAVNEINKKNL
ncbi:MAG: GMC family oxidoreductase, partial [Pedobacter sp.]